MNRIVLVIALVLAIVIVLVLVLVLVLGYRAFGSTLAVSLIIKGMTKIK